MKIKHKNITYKNKKKCIICGRECANNGIIIKNNYICEICIDEITFINTKNSRYDEIKDRIKINLFKDK